MEYIYPQNLKLVAQLWLWSIRDIVILITAGSLSAILAVSTHFILPLAITAVFGFISARVGGQCILDYITVALKYFVLTPQRYVRKTHYVLIP